jgi:hypothetical protein
VFNPKQLVLLVLLLVAVCAGAAPADEGQPLTIEAIGRAWKKRQDRMQSFRVEWSERQMIPKGLLSFHWRELGGQSPYRLKPADVVPPADTQHVLGYKVEAQGGTVAIAMDSFVWDTKSWSFAPAPLRTVFRDNVYRRLDARGEAHLTWPLGSNVATKQMETALNPHVRSWFYYVRAMDRRFGGLRVEKLRLMDRPTTIEGMSCAELRDVDPRDTGFRLWVTRDQHHVVVRESLLVGERIGLQITIQYRQDAEHGWVPKGWRITDYYDNGRRVKKSATTVRSFLTDVNSPRETFIIDFPPGTTVYDGTLPPKERNYIQKPSGGKRVITSSDIKQFNASPDPAKAYDELMNSSGPTWHSHQKGGFLGIALSVFLCLCVLGTGWCVMRRIIRVRQRS